MIKLYRNRRIKIITAPKGSSFEKNIGEILTISHIEKRYILKNNFECHCKQVVVFDNGCYIPRNDLSFETVVKHFYLNFNNYSFLWDWG